MVDEHTQFEMDCYEVETVEELKKIYEAQEDALEHILLDELAAEIDSGERPNQKDIAFILKTTSPLIIIPQAIREYAAKLLLSEVKGSQRNSRLRPDGKGLEKYGFTEKGKYYRLTAEHIFLVPDFKKLIKSSGMSKEDALRFIATSNLSHSIDDPSIRNLIGEAESKIEETHGTQDKNKKKLLINDAWNIINKACDKFDIKEIDRFDKNLEKEINRLSRIIYPRKR